MNIPAWLITAARLNAEAVYEILNKAKAKGSAHLTVQQVGHVLLEVRADKLAYLIEEPMLRDAWMFQAARHLAECYRERPLDELHLAGSPKPQPGWSAER